MKRSRIQLATRTAAAALAMVLAACDGDGISTPRELTGHWLAVDAQESVSGLRIEDRLELRADGDYAWITITFGPGGRASDGMLEWFSRGGDWGVDDGKLALRTTTGTLWQNSPSGGGWSTLDFAGEWNYGHRLRREGDQLILEEKFGPPPPNVRQPIPRSYVFHRVANFDDAPPPPAGP